MSQIFLPHVVCRQGYACPQFHNNKDRRRSPKKFKYRSTPCPAVKTADEWGDPVNCDSGDSCQYCHTRTEQQFHPEIYKSTKCNDIQNTSYCPRGAFCAFAHVERKLENNLLLFSYYFSAVTGALQEARFGALEGALAALAAQKAETEKRD